MSQMAKSKIDEDFGEFTVVSLVAVVIPFQIGGIVIGRGTATRDHNEDAKSRREKDRMMLVVNFVPRCECDGIIVKGEWLAAMVYRRVELERIRWQRSFPNFWFHAVMDLETVLLLEPIAALAPYLPMHEVNMIL